MNFLNKMLVIVSALALTACASTQPLSKVELSASLTTPCEPLELLQGTTGKDLTNNIVDNAAIHFRCVDKYNALIEATKNK